jgi:TRIAD3 protein (E3 ubiquitin-protein ligase RNF216)
MGSDGGRIFGKLVSSPKLQLWLPETKCLFSDICCEDLPSNRMASCTIGKHSSCFVCVRKYVESIIGQNKYFPRCMDSDCKGVYAKTMLRPLLDKSIMDRMERLEQNEQLKNVEGIEECPFCNFKAVPHGSTTVFDCQNPECEKSSCRKCKELSHIPKTCKEAEEWKSAGANMNIRHLLEEAMSRAAMRVCHVCETAFVKEEGCNYVSIILSSRRTHAYD